MTGDDLNWTVEQACTNAYPSPRQVLLGGWLLRLSGGPVRRTSSVNPLRGAGYDLAPVMDDCAAIYAAAGLPLRFRVPTIAAGMEVALDRLGYPVRQEVRTLFADLGATEADAAVALAPDPEEDWLAARARMAGDDAAADAAYRRMANAIALPRAFATLRAEGEVAALAYGAVDRALLVLNSVATAERFRGRGFARRTVGALMGWAAGRNARGACLQVAADNRGGQALYAALGFKRELYRYQHRGGPA